MTRIEKIFKHSIVIGLCGRIGVDFEYIFKTIESIIPAYNTNKCKYKVIQIHISKIIGEEVGEDWTTLWKKIKGCNKYVKDKKVTFLVKLVNEKIRSTIKKKSSDQYIFLVRSLKRLEELKFFQRIYGRSFYSIGFHLACEQSLEYIKDKKDVENIKSIGKLTKLIMNDESQRDVNGQDLSNVFPYCDYYIDQSVSVKTALYKSLKRFFNIIFGKCFVPPTIEEIGMDYAFTSAVKSTDQSRQVGSCILDSSDNLLITGTNGVPKYGGGIYKHFFGKDPNNSIKSIQYQKVKSILKKNLNKKDKMIRKIAKEIINDTKLKDILEYSNALHAEQNAISSAAEKGITLKGSTFYVSTFPCHLCTKLIISSGIKKVVYLHPYPKSLALKLHSDSVSLHNERGKVFFKHFEGVSPYRFLELFSWGKRENEGYKIETINKLKLGHVKINSLRKRMYSCERKEEEKPDYSAIKKKK